MPEPWRRGGPAAHSRARRARPAGHLGLALFLWAGVAACSGDAGRGSEPTGVPAAAVDVRIPEGAGARAIATRLAESGLVRHPRWFGLYLRFKGATRELQAGHYRLPANADWGEIVRALRTGDVVTVPLTIPEGFTLREIAPRVAALTGAAEDSVLRRMRDTALARALGAPGPTLEGYLFPETYRFAERAALDDVLATMVRRYQAFWGAAERRRADSLALSERQVVTLASIVEKEARRADERPIIAGVYLNRLRRGMLLQADPTVQFALGETRAHLLYRDIDRVADNPYNTYTHGGLPPGPIASPGEASLRATLQPARVPYLFFVARPDGSHIFSISEREHINAKNRVRRRRGP
ncbi:MAG: endolytic transglycosylase MltG [Gemmatimonadota bacterium]